MVRMFDRMTHAQVKKRVQSILKQRKWERGNPRKIRFVINIMYLIANLLRQTS
jgi:hypothetical protein